MRDRFADEVVGLVDEVQRLLEVDDVNAVALGEDEPLHLRVPATSLMPEVNAAFQQLAHSDDRSHAGVPFLSETSCRARQARLPVTFLAPVRPSPLSYLRRTGERASCTAPRRRPGRACGRRA